MDEYNIINNAVSYKKGQSGFSRSSYDTVVFIPEYYFRIIDDAANKKRYFYIADKAKSLASPNTPAPASMSAATTRSPAIIQRPALRRWST